MIKIERKHKDINIKLEILFADNDLCALITGGDKAHIGSISVYSKEEGIQTISLRHHKDYIIGELFINNIKDIAPGNISVSCGIHVDNISKDQIKDIYNNCNIIFEEAKLQIINSFQAKS